MKEEIKRIIAETLEIDETEIEDTTNLAQDLDVESLDLVDLVVAFEEKYGIEIPDQDIKNLQTINDIVEYIEKNDSIIHNEE